MFRLTVSADRSTHFSELLWALYREHGVLTVAVELAEGEQRTLYVNPLPDTPGYAFSLRQITALLAITKGSD